VTVDGFVAYLGAPGPSSTKETWPREMMLEELHGLNPEARYCGGGLRGPCPSCGGKNNSSKFSVTERDGMILVHCFAGCTTADICRALGIELKDLFCDSHLTSEQHRARPPRPKRFDWRKMSHEIEFASEHHWLRAEAIFKAARQCDVSAMNDEDLDAAWRCLVVGFHALRVSENLRTTAFQLRVNGMADEARRHRDRKAAA